MIIIDASVAVKWVVEEPTRDLALKVLELNVQLIAPKARVY